MLHAIILGGVTVMRTGSIGLITAVVLTISGMEGCSSSDIPAAVAPGTPVALSAVFSEAKTITSLSKDAGFAAVDSLIIDSAIVVFDRIKFESHVESEMDDDTLETNDLDEVEDDSIETEHEFNVTLRGPFVVHVRDPLAISFADGVVPAGTYTAIKFKIHRLRAGEEHEDSDEHNGRSRTLIDPTGYEASIVVWGKVRKDGGWVSFTLKYNGEATHHIHGNFVVPEATNTISFALTFNTELWFRNRETGALLDPTDTSEPNQASIMQAIKHSFARGEGGRDDDRDGHPDD